ncbi:MAG: hypothetical protein A2Y33_06300 [Spirochaetes bacterium GWF1_51_8]|nr:MAG: hypothetical protein A2Y33_06300 [Spirochaetes bacterium GWF1_51_8]
MYQEKDFDSIKVTIVSNLPGVKKIVLFGSYAKNTASDDSDIDIAILTELPVDRREKLSALSSIRWVFGLKGYKTDIIVKTEAEYEEEKTLPSLSSVIAREGKVLWTKN